MSFLLFGYDMYYPSGGWNDYLGSFDTEAEAIVTVENWPEDDYRNQYLHIVDIKAGRIIKRVVRRIKLPELSTSSSATASTDALDSPFSTG